MPRSETWLLIHIEVQGEPEKGFPLRMFRYNVRAFERYNRTVVSLAVLTDERSEWRPSRFEYGAWGASTAIHFLNVKLIDWQGRHAELQASTNPFAHVVFAHLRALETRRDLERRRQYKLAIVKGLYQHGWTAEDVRLLFGVIDWLLDLPDELKQGFEVELHVWEEENRMPYVTSIERTGIAKGLKQGRREGLLEAIKAALAAKFGKPATRLMPRVRLVDNTDDLLAMLNSILAAASLQDVRERLPVRKESSDG